MEVKTVFKSMEASRANMNQVWAEPAVNSYFEVKRIS